MLGDDHSLHGDYRHAYRSFIYNEVKIACQLASKDQLCVLNTDITK